MTLSRPVLLTLFVVSACASAPPTTEMPPPASTTPTATAPGRYTRADVAFMQGMIRHHAQAVLMASWAPTHGAGARLRTLAERIDVSQRDEIALMERWLRERGEEVPDADPMHSMHAMHQGLMPGMLTMEQLTQLDQARGTEFDRQFLSGMIYHHRGAITMVEELFRAPGAAQEEVIFRFASDVNADQLADIDRMTQMLENLPNGGN